MYQAKKDSIKIGKILMETARRVSKDEKVNWLAINRVKENWYSMACHGTMKPEPKPRQKNLRKMEAYR